jgi:cardiolipin synthase
MTFAFILIAVLVLAVVLLSVALWSLTHIRAGRWDKLEPLDSASERFPHLCANLCLSSICEGNSVRLLQNGEGFWPELLEAIGRAEVAVHLETFLWKTGVLSASLAEALCERAAAGVQVRVVIDDVGGMDMLDEERARLRESGVQLAMFRPRTWRHIGTFNGRDHRKLAIVDARTAFIGGHCVTDAWRGTASNPREVRDTSARVEGPIVAQMQRAFAENWTEVTGELLGAPEHFPALPPCGDTSAFLAFINFEQRVSSIKTLHMLAVSSAKRTLLIQNPYFILDKGAQQTLVRAVERGVRVRVMTSSAEATDNQLVFHAMRHGLRPLLEAGIEVYLYERCLLHQKVVVVDGHWSILGSANFDFRSFEINEEASMSAFDRTIASELEAAFERDLGCCYRFTEAHLDQRSVREWIADFLAWQVREQL